MEAQEIFDTVINHLWGQGQQALDEEGECVYRHETDDGTILKCAIGCFITDDDYSKAMEGREVNLLLRQFPQETAAFRGHLELVMGLQDLHDATCRTGGARLEHWWRRVAQKLAEKHELVFTEPSSFG